MRSQKFLVIGISLALAAALPAMADQSRGGAGQRGGSMPTGQMQRGTTQRDRLRDQDQVYGYQLMTSSERNEYRNQMRALRTQQERDALRAKHHEQMQKRAAERGVTLPDMPRQGMGPGQGGRGNGAGIQQRSQQQIQQQRTEQQEQQSQDNGN
ncbi:MAG TPA: hypothetical protein VNE18_01970 [Rhodanobacter sp.]|nr:hypothetical protein [Rhodanobacter sp.]